MYFKAYGLDKTEEFSLPQLNIKRFNPFIGPACKVLEPSSGKKDNCKSLSCNYSYFIFKVKVDENAFISY